MRTKAVWIAALLLIALLGLLPACTTEEAEELSRFVGLWRLSMVGDPSDPAMDVRFNDDDTIAIYDRGSTAVKLAGVYTATDGAASGTWQHLGFASVYGSFRATLGGDDILAFTFIEEQYDPDKSFEYTGVRIE